MTTRYRDRARPDRLATDRPVTPGPLPASRGGFGYYPLVAGNARNSTGGGWCCLCHEAIRAGERIADLADGETAHVACVAATGQT